MLASDRLCTDVVMKDGARLRFDHVGLQFIWLDRDECVRRKASGLAPRIASCGGVGTPNFHRTSPLGHHFHPTLIDMKDAVSRYKEMLEEVEFWPQCPQYGRSRIGVVRISATARGATAPPRNRRVPSAAGRARSDAASTTRPRPDCLARYIAASASLISVSGSSPSRGYWLTPILQLI